MMDTCGCGKPARYVEKADGEFIGSCNKYRRCPSCQDLEKKIGVLTAALNEYRQAMELTRQYVGYMTLPAIEGWSWYDADQKAKEALAE